MSDEDLIYYRQRAAREMEMARRASHPNAVRAHELLAAHYRDIVESDAQRTFSPPRARLRAVA